MLKAGGPCDPLALKQKAGTEMRSSQPIHDDVAYAGRLIEQLEASLDCAR